MYFIKANLKCTFSCRLLFPLPFLINQILLHFFFIFDNNVALFICCCCCCCYSFFFVFILLRKSQVVLGPENKNHEWISFTTYIYSVAAIFLFLFFFVAFLILIHECVLYFMWRVDVTQNDQMQLSPTWFPATTMKQIRKRKNKKTKMTKKATVKIELQWCGILYVLVYFDVVGSILNEILCNHSNGIQNNTEKKWAEKSWIGCN